MLRPVLSGLLVLAALTACWAPFDPTVCTLEARPSFAVTVEDSVSGADLAPEATVWVREGAFVDTLLPAPGGVYSGAHERPGTYEVVAEHPDYLDWHRTGVRVREGECHVITREITARLAPRP